MKHVDNPRFCGLLMAAQYQIINSVMGYKQGRRTALAWRFRAADGGWCASAFRCSGTEDCGSSTVRRMCLGVRGPQRATIPPSISML